MFESWAAVRSWNLPIPINFEEDIGAEEARRSASFRGPRAAGPSREKRP